MKVELKIYHLWDEWGNEVVCVATNSHETVCPHGLINKSGRMLYFESEAYHLERWAKDNDLGFAVHKHEIEIEKP